MPDHSRAGDGKKTVSRKSVKRDADRLQTLLYSSPTSLAARNNALDLSDISQSASRSASRNVSRNVSRNISRVQSREESRVPSREQSDDELETGSESGETSLSTVSFDERLGEISESGANIDRSLPGLIEDLVDRKHDSLRYREENLLAYSRILAHHYAAEELEDHVDDLLIVFMQSIQQESSEKETVLALRSASLTAVTSLDGAIYSRVSSLVKQKITGVSSLPVKVAALRCLGACTYFGGAGEEEIIDELEFLIEIVTSNGHFADAPDDPEIVATALQEWGLLATRAESLEELSEDAVEAFADQLENSDTDVQVAAGQNIALLYERSFSTLREDDELNERDLQISLDDISKTDYKDDNGTLLVQHYKPYHDTPKIEQKVRHLSNVSGQRASKKSKRSLHMHFDAILTTIENPCHGPRYGKLMENEKSESYGERTQVKFRRFAPLNVNRWWKWMRLVALQRLLEGGVIEHLQAGSPAITNNLPGLSMEAPPPVKRPKQTRGKGKEKRAVDPMKAPSGRSGEMEMLFDTLHV
ncbi:hypothetical protein LOZ51_005373 [Ophidiomyces ophidiicola]|nr:hypothetical protein LOZ55_003089 [Ophidiomyces ophidiicola]KAI1988556.1 hypothetical protein LOZ51_005373 [Ophidiomyces ophidiicola]KAI1989599.1 hypothetical protein LOZ54_002801 [Ophidiomyces ophidiicola]